METNQSQNQAAVAPTRATFVQPRTYLSKDREYLTLVLPGNVIVRKHVNFFKAAMGLAFEKKVPVAKAS